MHPNCSPWQAPLDIGWGSDNRHRSSKLETPCVNLCVIDLESGLCAGCSRTIDEISRWAQLTTTERHAIMAALPSRRRQAQRDV
ncbi:MAG: DUF1289 domain-containing protein [Methyloligellaceae bacterium]